MVSTGTETIDKSNMLQDNTGSSSSTHSLDKLLEEAITSYQTSQIPKDDDIYNDETAIERYKRAKDEDEWDKQQDDVNMTTETRCDSGSAVWSVCDSGDKCCYKQYIRKENNIASFRLRGTHIILCNQCINEGMESNHVKELIFKSV